MAGNSILNKSKSAINNDEFYTTYDTIVNEVSHYEQHFKDKIVFCNCDDPFESSFAKFFIKNFNKLELKTLLCTSYCLSKIALTRSDLTDENGEKLTNEQGYILSLSEVPEHILPNSDDDTVHEWLKNNSCVKKLKGTGDFRSEECVEYLKSADIIVTNPPFSLFKELIALIIKYNKKFLVIGNANAITYKEIFPLIQNNRIWIGNHFGEMEFKVPDDSEKKSSRFWIDETGQKWRSLGNAMWLTNLDINRRHQELVLTVKYNPKTHPTFDEYDAIECTRVSNIPMDYEGIMAVPITFLNKHNPDQFEIVGEANHGSDNPFDLFKPTINGKLMYKRILIRNKLLQKEKTDMVRFKILDLFCGAGGFSYGMEQNPQFSTVIALDNDTHVGETFKKNMPHADVIIGDITNDEIKKDIINKAKDLGVNMIIGGPPCQGYSNKGKKLGLADPRNFLFREYLNFVKELQPDVFVIENVKTLLSASNGWFKDEIVKEISSLGYTVEFGVMNASNYGVPQARERAIFICSKHNAISLPAPTVTKITTVRDAIEDLAYLNSGEGEFKQEYLIEAKSDYQKLMRKDSKHLHNHIASKHKQVAIDKLTLIPPEKGKECLPAEMHGKQKFKTTWGRLKWDEASPTIDTRFDAASNGTNNHPFLHRAITPREAARIQSFDDKFIFMGSKVHIRKQIGNAVPPLMAKAIADQISNTIDMSTPKEEL